MCSQRVSFDQAGAGAAAAAEPICTAVGEEPADVVGDGQRRRGR